MSKPSFAVLCALAASMGALLALPAAAGDLRAFLSPQPTSAAPKETGAGPAVIQSNSRQPSTPAKSRSETARNETARNETARAEADRARLAAAERMAAEERSKAQLAWARREAQKAAAQMRARVKWTAATALLILLATLTLLWLTTREQKLRGRACRVARSYAP
jgi:hypothetical protein